jgi:hypothetical protein
MFRVVTKIIGNLTYRLNDDTVLPQNFSGEAHFPGEKNTRAPDGSIS